jgi:ABC-type uncharacterized transport system involved in gliding motility auxiliary subunit
MKSDISILTGALGVLFTIFGALEISFRARTATTGKFLVAAGFILIIFALFKLRTRIKELLSRRAFIYDANNIIYTVVVALILFIINGFAINYSEHVFFLPKWDLTRNSFYTLSPQSLKAVSNIQDDIECLVFYISPRGSGSAANMINLEILQMTTLMKLYKGACSKFSFRFVDPEKDPSLAEKYKITIPGTVILRKKDREIKIRRWAIFRPADPVKNIQAAFTGEQAISNGLARLNNATVPVVYFITGHKEANLNDSELSGLTTLARKIRSANYHILQLNLAMSGHVPKNASAIIIPGSRTDFSIEEEKMLSEFIKNGGNTIFLLDTWFRPFISRILAPYGILLSKNLVVDPKSSFFGRPTWPIPTLNEHIITEELLRYNRIPTFPNSIGMDKNLAESKYMIRTIAQSSDESWATTDFSSPQLTFNKGTDPTGPLSLVYAITSNTEGDLNSSNFRKDNEFRMIVTGDSDFITNRTVDMQANSDFFLNCLAWVTGEADRITVSPKVTEGEKIPLTEKQGTTIIYACSLALPAIILLGGTLVWWRRRNK